MFSGILCKCAYVHLGSCLPNTIHNQSLKDFSTKVRALVYYLYRCQHYSLNSSFLPLQMCSSFLSLQKSVLYSLNSSFLPLKMSALQSVFQLSTFLDVVTRVRTLAVNLYRCKYQSLYSSFLPLQMSALQSVLQFLPLQM